MVRSMSLWNFYQKSFHLKKLTKSMEVDTLIIGGGLTGLTTFYYLKEKSSICLVEANTLGSGVSQNTTGKITFLQGNIYHKLEKNISYKVAKDYLKSQLHAIFLLKDIIKKEKISCDLDEVDSYVYAQNKKEIVNLKQEKTFLENQGIKVYENKKSDISGLYSISVNQTYVFNPIKFLNGLIELLPREKMFEHTKIYKIIPKNNKYYCIFDKGYIIANKVIVACHYPFFQSFLLPLKSHIEKSYIVAYKVKEKKNYSGITVSNPGFSYRYYQDKEKAYKICLGQSHNTAIKQNDVQNFQKVIKQFQINSNDIVSVWSNMDIVTQDQLPFIGEFKKNFYLATGFNTWGMTNGIIAAKILADNILNFSNPYADLFCLKKKNFYKFKNFFLNVGSNFYAFIKSKRKQKKWYSKNLKFINLNGQSIAIYVDSDKIEHSVYTTCPHLGCSLVFNEAEKTWDCPCHSSRFDIDGHCLKGPSKFDITYKKK